ncbi:hypothetical protein SADUNF_Sadunf18G0099400 [Salix dunnii]|uniref:Uncharacterized protein n=1 Tax=Salix dunnii TaxID=1413687 RepID=A0A835ME54_9ROSI|nr:hypothetical protein SADUNF_Sadunf18G0099400 [Salix dunnii]
MRSHLLEKSGHVRNNGENSTGVLYLMAKASSLNVIPQKKLERLSLAETAYQRFFLVSSSTSIMIHHKHTGAS